MERFVVPAPLSQDVITEILRAGIAEDAAGDDRGGG